MEQICFELEDVEVNFLDKTVLKVDRLAIHQLEKGLLPEKIIGSL